MPPKYTISFIFFSAYIYRIIDWSFFNCIDASFNAQISWFTQRRNYSGRFPYGQCGFWYRPCPYRTIFTIKFSGQIYHCFLWIYISRKYSSNRLIILHYFRPKTNNQPLKKFLSLAVSWVKVIKNCTSFWKIKWFKKWSFQKMSITKSVPLKSYYSEKKKIRKIRIIFYLQNWLWKSEFCHF